MDAKYMTRSEAARYIGVSEQALEQMATRGTGPKFAKLSTRTVRYRVCDVDEWIESKLQASTKPS